MLNNVRQCEQQTKRATKCRAPAVRSKPYCLAHAPVGTEEHERMQVARQRGGSTTKTDMRAVALVANQIQTAKDVRVLAASLIEELKAGNVNPSVCGAIYSMSQLCLMALRIEAEERRAGLDEDGKAPTINVIHQDYPDPDPDPVDPARQEILDRLNDGNPSAGDVIRSRRDTNGGFARD